MIEVEPGNCHHPKLDPGAVPVSVANIPKAEAGVNIIVDLLMVILTRQLELNFDLESILQIHKASTSRRSDFIGLCEKQQPEADPNQCIQGTRPDQR